MNKKRFMGILVIVMALGMTVSGCDDGGNTGQPEIFTCTVNDESYELTITNGSSFKLQIGSDISTGAASKDGNIWTLTPIYGGPFTVTVSGNSITKIEGTITFDDETEKEIPGEVAGPENFHIYLCFGQSNMEGVNNTTNHLIPPEYKTWTNDRFQVLASVNMSQFNPARQKENWYTAAPPLVRGDRGLCPADNFGRTLVEKISNPKIKIGVIIVAVSGAALDIFDKVNYESYINGLDAGTISWMSGSYNLYNSNPYARLVELAKIAQEDGVIKGILLHQGESAGGTPTWGANVKRIYDDLLSDLGLAPTSIPLLAGEPIRWNKNLINGLPAISPQFYAISSSGCEALTGGDADHFSPAGMMELGKRYGEKMFDLLYK
ncbi:MAG: sialate O-acetylesterase [Treponema sp.]|jgi:hypothetical protein|nr:sialate O-acetylesterase [Treponema sp.]